MNFKTKVASLLGAGIIALGGTTGIMAQQGPTSLPVDVVVGAPSDATISWSVLQTADWPVVESSLTQAQTVNGRMTVTVQDNRFNFAGWELSVRSEDFEPAIPTNPASIPVENFAIDTGEVIVLQGQPVPLPVANDIVMSEDFQPLFVAAPGSGSGRYSVGMTGSITIPANTPADTYASTIYISLNAAP